MRVSIKKTVVAAIAALGIATAVASTPAQAQWHGGGGFHGGGFHGGGFHGGGFGGGFHGGGWHGGGWGGGWHGGWGRPGWGGGGWGWRRAGWNGGWGGGWGGGCWNCGWGWGYDPGWAIAATALPLGVAIAANAAQPAYGGDPHCWVRRRVWTARGHYLGRRLVNLCY